MLLRRTWFVLTSNYGALSRKRRVRLGLVVVDSPRWTAGGIYARNLVYTLASLPAYDRPHVEIVGASDANSPLLRDLCSFEFVRMHGTEPEPRPDGTLRRLGRNLRAWQYGHRDRDKLDVFYPAGFGVDVAGAARLYWIADFQHVHLPHLFSSAELESRQNGMARIAREDAVLVLSSESALRDFRTLFPGALIRPRVWSFCSNVGPFEAGGADPRRAYGLPEKFLYLPNQFWVHKDHLTAFKAVAILRAKGMIAPLVCTGREEDYRNLGHFGMLTEYLKQDRLDSQVLCLGLVPRPDQIQIFRHAAAVIQPSLFEGWSTVVEDAKTLGRPLVLSDIPPHREQATEGSRFFRPGSAEDLGRVLEELWPDLLPGPAPAAEQAALAMTAERRLRSARDFMVIVDEAVAVGHRR